MLPGLMHLLASTCPCPPAWCRRRVACLPHITSTVNLFFLLFPMSCSITCWCTACRCVPLRCDHLGRHLRIRWVEVGHWLPLPSPALPRWFDRFPAPIPSTPCLEPQKDLSEQTRRIRQLEREVAALSGAAAGAGVDVSSILRLAAAAASQPDMLLLQAEAADAVTGAAASAAGGAGQARTGGSARGGGHTEEV